MTAPLLHDAGRPVDGIDPGTAVQILPPGVDRTDRARWLAVRRVGLGGSDVSTVVGLNKWSSRYELWLDKTGQLPLVDEQSEAAEMGALLEPVVRDRFARSWGLEVRQVGTLRSARWPWMLTNPDGLCSDGAGLECKTCSVWMAHEWAGGQTADHAELQAQWGMAVTGLDHWWVAVLIGGQHSEYRLITRDQELIDELVAISGRFWRDHVLAQVPPPLDGSSACTELLRDRYPVAHDNRAVEVDPDVRDEITLLAEKTAAGEKAAKADRDALKNRVRGLLGDAERLVCGEQEIATWRNTGQFCEARFRAAHPDLAARYVTTVEVVDTDRLAADHPELHTAFRARVLTFKH
jgi:putative phage-type endonuclease